MAEYTKNFNLIKPSQEDFYNVDDFNDNFEKIDQMAVKKGNGIAELIGGTLANRPAPEIIGRYYFAQDTGEIFLDTGTEWVLAAASREEFVSHLAEDVTQEDVIQTTEVNDSMKVPSSAVTYGINQKFEGLSFLSLITPGRVKKIKTVTDVADLDNCKNTGVYAQEIPGSYASVLTFNMSSLLDRDNVIQIRAYSFVATVEIRHYYEDNWTNWVALIP